ncbi:PfkB family carbohydrate kinase [uncultured Microbacterium sp.]|uniref:PfkB family carbohydrate kinase n=1 Tax=uncultured Microbacterium sp. TaxID=191216 RepID=UPI0025E778B4|nr:PfkB family carbohydrate kinase [uncultured Microbacterium sp.]
MSGRIVVIGDALIDEIRDDAGVREFVGGAGLNVAVGLSRLGVPASLIAMVGDDAAGDQIRAYLAECDVELLASPAEHGSSRAVSTRSAEGEPQYVFNDAAQNRRVAYGASERAAIADAPMVVVSCFPFDDRAQTDALVDAVASAGTPLAIDPNPRSGMLHDRDEFVRGFERAASGALLVKVGEDDAQLLYGTSLDDLRDRLTGLGVDAVLATYGAGGAAIVAGDVTVSRGISNLPGPIVDTMGGGDAVLATTAALVRERLPGAAEDWDAVLSRAMDVAAATCRSEGALLRTPE